MVNNLRSRYIVINARFLTQPITGVQRFAIEICRFLKDILPNVHFVAPSNIKHQELAKEFKVETFGKFSSHFWEQLELPLYLHRSGKPLLVNLCNTAPVYYSNKVVCIHDLASLINPQWFSKSFAAVYKILIPKVAGSSKKIITVSNFSKASIHSILHIPQKDIEVVYNAVSESFVSNNYPASENKYGRYILAVSSIDPRKNLKNLVEGYKLANLTGVKLVIVGAASKVFNDPNLKHFVQGREDIVFTGYLPDKDLVQVYKNALMLVYPSLFEGFGIPPLEAMYCGCPTIVSNTSSLPEVCANASLYVNPLLPNEIANGIKLLAENEEIRKKLVLKGFKRSQEFSWKKSAGKLANIINTLNN